MTVRAAAPLVTAVVTTHDDCARMSQLVSGVKSLIRQGVAVVIVDDGSTDETAELLCRALDGDRGVSILAEPVNQGVAAARNRALAIISTPLVIFLDPDDEWPPGAMSVLSAPFSDDSVDVVIGAATVREHRFSGSRIVDGSAHRLELSGVEARLEMLEGHLHGYLWNKMFRVSRLEHHFPALSSQSDFPFVYQAVGRARKVVMVPGVVYTHVLRAGSLSQSHTREQNLATCLSIVKSDNSTLRDLSFFEAWFHLDAAGRLLLRSGATDSGAVAQARKLAKTVGRAHLYAALSRRRFKLALRLSSLALARYLPCSYITVGHWATRAAHARRPSR